MEDTAEAIMGATVMATVTASGGDMDMVGGVILTGGVTRTGGTILIIPTIILTTILITMGVMGNPRSLHKR